MFYIQNAISILTVVLNSTIAQIVVSAFCGGLFAGIFTNHFESKRRVNDRRTDKYYEHRNTIVQIEHELIPIRVNLSRNLSMLKDAISTTNENNTRIILRFYKFNFSTGLSLKLLNIDLINEYSYLYSALETINSDIEYIFGIINILKENLGKQPNLGLISSYVTMLDYLHDKCDEADRKSLEILSKCKVILEKDDALIKKDFLENGESIKYKYGKQDLARHKTKIEKEESPILNKGADKPKFFYHYLDLRKVLVNPPTQVA